jgi:Gamma-glutamyl cyclotransferase, AIG2-like
VTELLFSYGTLRQREVQLTTFGRELEGRPDAVVGYDLDYVTITDPHVIATSGSDRHPILRPTERADAAVEGTVFAISTDELAAADEYEVDATCASQFRCGQALKPGFTSSPMSACAKSDSSGQSPLLELALHRIGPVLLHRDLAVDRDLAVWVR